jgi:hypothetical protein
LPRMGLLIIGGEDKDMTPEYLLNQPEEPKMPERLKDIVRGLSAEEAAKWFDWIDAGGGTSEEFSDMVAKRCDPRLFEDREAWWATSYTPVPKTRAVLEAELITARHPGCVDFAGELEKVDTKA